MRYVLAAFNGILALGVIIWPMAAISGVMSFAAPGAGSNLLTNFFVLSVFCYPVPVIVGNIMFWKNWKIKTNGKLFFYTLISASGYATIVLVVILLEVFCRGKFACN